MMQRKLVGIFLVCVVLLVAIVAGYWDMLQSERLRISNPPESATGTDSVSQATTPDDGAPRAGTATTDATAGNETPADGTTEASGASGDRAVPAAQAPDPSGGSTAEPGAGEMAEASPVDAGPQDGDAPTDIVVPPATTPGAVAARTDAGQAGTAATADRAAPAEADASASPASREAEDTAAPLPDRSDRTASDLSDASPGDTVRQGTPAPAGSGAPRTAATGDSARRDDADLGAVARPPASDSAPSGEAAAVDALSAPGIAGGGDPRPEGDAADATPRFDLLRVEPDGATVIAGRAAPGSRIALRDGEDILGTDTANAAGEFAIALEAPLASGDHAIRIVATGEDGAIAVSEEIAIVAVPPPGRESELLAMVEAPNAPSRLISLPGDDPRATTAPDRSPATATAGADATGPKGTRSGSATPPAGPGIPDGGTVTLPRALPQAPASAVAATSVPMLRVEAVEIEAGKVFVAGAAEAGALVRIYIDNVLLAEDRATPEGRFLVSADAPVAPGERIVRADQLARDGSVAERAEVPFERPEGTSVAMVAPRPEMGTEAAEEAAAETARPAPPSQSPAPSASPPSELAAGDRVRTPSRNQGNNGDSEAASAVPATGARDSTLPVVPGDAAGSEAPGAVAGNETPDEPAGAEPSNQTAGADASAVMAAADRDAGADRPDAVQAPAALVEAPASVDDPHAAPVQASEAVAPSPGPSGDTAPQDIVPVTRQQALTTAPGRVIIRRGDTLWRISRENYGFGSRYVVIYLANGDQIRDPHLIYPGQVFSVPKARVETSGAEGSG